MKLKCDDGIVRKFTTASEDKEAFTARNSISESRCCNCGEYFGCHDTYILKPIWKKHVCKKESLDAMRVKIMEKVAKEVNDYCENW